MAASTLSGKFIKESIEADITVFSAVLFENNKVNIIPSAIDEFVAILPWKFPVMESDICKDKEVKDGDAR